MKCLNRRGSVGGSDFFVSLALSGVDAGDDGSDSLESVLGLLDLGDGHVGGVDGDLVGSSISFVLGQLVDVDHPLLSEDLNDFSLAALLASTKHDDLIILADGEGADAPLLAKILGEGGGHDSVADVRWGGEVGSSLFSSAAANLNVSLHH